MIYNSSVGSEIPSPSHTQALPLVSSSSKKNLLLTNVLDLALKASKALNQQKKMSSSLVQSVKSLPKDDSIRLIKALLDGALSMEPPHMAALSLEALESLVSLAVSQDDPSLSALLSSALLDALDTDRSPPHSRGRMSLSFFLMGLEIKEGRGDDEGLSAARHASSSLDHLEDMTHNLQQMDESLISQLVSIWPSLSFYGQMILDLLESRLHDCKGRSLMAKALSLTLDLGRSLVSETLSKSLESSREEYAMTAVASGIGIVRIHEVKAEVESPETLIDLSRTLRSLSSLIDLSVPSPYVSLDEAQWAATSLSNTGIALIQIEKHDSASLVLDVAVQASMSRLRHAKGSESELKVLVDKRMRAHVTAVAAQRGGGSVEASHLAARNVVQLLDLTPGSDLISHLIPLVKLHVRHRIKTVAAEGGGSEEIVKVGKVGREAASKQSRANAATPPFLTIHLSEAGITSELAASRLDVIAAEELDAIADEMDRGTSSSGSSASKPASNYLAEAAQVITGII